MFIVSTLAPALTETEGILPLFFFFSLQGCGLARFTGPLHQGNVISLQGLGPGQVSYCCEPCLCLCLRACVCVLFLRPRACVLRPARRAWTSVMDDEDELINTKGLSLRLHPNLARRAGTVSQPAETWE